MNRIAQIEAALDALGDAATAGQIAHALRGFDKRDIQAVLAARSGEGGGAALTVTGDTGSVADVATLNLGGSTVLSGGVGVADVELAIRTVPAVLTNAQIKALPTTPVEILAAPEAGTIHVPLLMVLYCDTTDFQYGNIEAEASVFDLGGTLNPIHQLADSGVELLLANFAPTYLVMAAKQIQFPTDDVFLYAAGFEDSGDPVSLFASNIPGGGDFTGGDASVTMKVRLAYYAISVA